MGIVEVEDRRPVLEATVDDPDDAPEDLVVTWRSNLAGVLVGPDRVDPSGRLEGALHLAEGNHEITLTVADPNGGLGRDVSGTGDYQRVLVGKRELDSEIPDPVSSSATKRPLSPE